MGDLAYELNRLAGTTNLDAQGAANVLASTTQKDLVGAMNIAAGTTGLGLNGAIKAYAGAHGGNSSLDANGALVSATTSGGFSPLSISGLIRWGDPQTLSAGAISSYPDSSPAGTTLTQSTSASQPVVVANVLSGKNVVRFDGVNDFLVSANLTTPAAQPNTAMMVAKFNAAATGVQKILDGGGAGRNAIYTGTAGNGNNTLTTYCGGLGVVAATQPGTAWNIIVVQFNGTSTTIWLNGGIGTVGNDGTDSQGRITVGCDTGQGVQFFAGDMADNIFYNALVSKANLNLLGAWLVAKYPALSWTTIP